MTMALRMALVCCLAAGLGTAQRHSAGGFSDGGIHSGGGVARGSVGGSAFRGSTGGFSHGSVGGAIGGGAFRGGFGGGSGFRGTIGGGPGNSWGYRGNYGARYRSNLYFGAGLGLGYWPPYYGYGYNPYYDYGYPADSYPSYSYPIYQPAPNVTVVYPPAPQPAATSIYAGPPAREYDEYGQAVHRATVPASSAAPVYLIAFCDHSIRATTAYWVDGETLHYITLEHEHKQAPVNTMDRALSTQLNRERNVAFTLPAGQ